MINLEKSLVKHNIRDPTQLVLQIDAQEERFSKTAPDVAPRHAQIQRRVVIAETGASRRVSVPENGYFITGNV